MFGNAGNDTLRGGDGTDVLYGWTGNDSLDGGAGLDVAGFVTTSSIVVDLINGTATDAGGTDSLSGIEIVHGWSQNDTVTLSNTNGGGVWAYGGDDSIIGGTGGEVINLGSGNDSVSAGGGTDLVSYFENGFDIASTQGVHGNLATGTVIDGWNNLDSLAFVEHLEGNNFGDTLIGNIFDNQLYGLGGSDSVYGGDGNDFLAGGGGDDSMYGGTGIDHLRGSAGNDTLYGGLDADMVSYAGATAGVNVVGLASATGDASVGVDALVDIEGFEGSAFGDSATGTVGSNVLFGGGGGDWLFSASGLDTVYGGDGDDSLIGGLGADALFGGAGNDKYYFDDAGDQATDQAGGGTRDLIYGGAFNVVLSSEIDGLVPAGAANVTGTGNAGINFMTGNDGNNTLLGLGGSDSLYGGLGNDRLDGGTEDDTFYGGAGNDSLIGGAGVDLANYADAGSGVTVVGMMSAAGNSLVGSDMLSSVEAFVGGTSPTRSPATARWPRRFMAAAGRTISTGAAATTRSMAGRASTR
jgi:Ca2+-binding RTX toxin-like protein